MGVVPHALFLSVEPVSVAGSPPSFLKKAVAKQHGFKGRSRMLDFLFLLYTLYILLIYYLLFIITFI